MGDRSEPKPGCESLVAKSRVAIMAAASNKGRRRAASANGKARLVGIRLAGLVGLAGLVWIRMVGLVGIRMAGLVGLAGLVWIRMVRLVWIRHYYPLTFFVFLFFRCRQ